MRCVVRGGQIRKLSMALAVWISCMACFAGFTVCVGAEELLFEGIKYQLEDEGAYIVEYVSDEKTVVIPDVVAEKPVVGIKDGAFEGNKYIQSVKMPKQLTSIGKNAFRRCYALESVVFSDKLTQIGENAFYECLELKTLTLPATVESLGADAFDYCTKLQKIDVAEGNAAFVSHDGVLFSADMLTLVKYPPSRQSKTYTLPSGVETIADRAFNYSYLLEKLTFSPELKAVGEYAFASCSSLQSLSFGENVEKIGAQFVANCNSLTEISFLNPKTDFGNLAGQKYDNLKLIVRAWEGSTAASMAAAFGFEVADLDNTDTELGAQTLSIETQTLDSSWRYFPYSQKIAVRGENVTISLKSGSALPIGLSLVDTEIVGRPANWGVYTFTLVATDAGGHTSERTYTLNINNNSYEKASSAKLVGTLPSKVDVVNGKAEDIVVEPDTANGDLLNIYINSNALTVDADYSVGDDGKITILGNALAVMTTGQNVLVLEFASGSFARKLEVNRIEQVLPENNSENDQASENSELPTDNQLNIDESSSANTANTQTPAQEQNPNTGVQANGMGMTIAVLSLGIITTEIYKKKKSR